MEGDVMLSKALANDLEYIKLHKDELHVVDTNQRGILHYAVTGYAMDVIKYLLSIDYNVNQVDIYGETPIFDAARKGYMDIATLLIHNHANVHITNRKGETLLHLAAFKGDIDNMKLYLEAKISPMLKTREDKLPIHYAISGGKNEAFQYLLKNTDIPFDYVDMYGNTFLHHAAKTSNPDVIKTCMKYKMNANALNDQFETPLFNAVKFGTVETVHVLLNYDSYIEIKNRRYETVIDLAKIHDKTEILEALRTYQITPKYERLSKQQALSIAVLNRDHVYVRRLIENDVLQRKDQFQLTAYDHAKMYGFQNIIALLKNYPVL